MRYFQSEVRILILSDGNPLRRETFIKPYPASVAVVTRHLKKWGRFSRRPCGLKWKPWLCVTNRSAAFCVTFRWLRGPRKLRCWGWQGSPGQGSSHLMSASAAVTVIKLIGQLPTEEYSVGQFLSANVSQMSSFVFWSFLMGSYDF